MRSQFFLYFIVLLIAVSSFCFSFLSGSMTLSWHMLMAPDDPAAFVFYALRLPRTVAAFTCGGLLALAGVLMQLLLRNPLADPYVLGTSSGAALCTLILMLLGANTAFILMGAWCGSLATVLLMIFLARKREFQTHTMLLLGVALASALSAGISLILLLSPASSLHSMLFWLTGDLNNVAQPWSSLAILVIGFVICMLLTPGFNLLSRGEMEAKALGLASKKYRITIYLLSSLFTASAVTLAGCIGFIGLIVPHLTRRLVGFNHQILIPIALLLGGSLLTLADTFARTLLAPQQLPVGIMMALIGVPFFIWLLQK